MELPILIKNSKVDYKKTDIQDLIRNVCVHCSKLDELSRLEITTSEQRLTSQTLYVIQDCIQILKHLKDNGYNVDIDFQVHNYELRDYKKAGKVDLSWSEETEAQYKVYNKQ